MYLLKGSCCASIHLTPVGVQGTPSSQGTCPFSREVGLGSRWVSHVYLFIPQTCFFTCQLESRKKHSSRTNGHINVENTSLKQIPLLQDFPEPLRVWIGSTPQSPNSGDHRALLPAGHVDTETRFSPGATGLRVLDNLLNLEEKNRFNNRTVMSPDFSPPAVGMIPSVSGIFRRLLCCEQPYPGGLGFRPCYHVVWPCAMGPRAAGPHAGDGGRERFCGCCTCCCGHILRPDRVQVSSCGFGPLLESENVTACSSAGLHRLAPPGGPDAPLPAPRPAAGTVTSSVVLFPFVSCFRDDAEGPPLLWTGGWRSSLFCHLFREHRFLLGLERSE